MGIQAKIFPEALTTIEMHAERLARRMAEGAVYILREQLEAGPRSGIPRAGMIRPPSVYGEYPQEQTGELLRSITVQQVDRYRNNIGFSGLDPSKLFELEFGTPQQGGRAPLTNHMTDPDTFAAIELYVETVPKI